MTKSGVLSMCGLVSALAVSGYAQGVVAQVALQIGGTTANFGSIRLAPGFMPDPANVNITAGGSIDARTLNLGAGCIGFVTRQPDYILNLTGPSPNLRVHFTVPNARALSPTDTTLLINTASGAWRCNDDTGGANPSVDLANATAGHYDIWVGSYHAGDNAAGVLHITELPASQGAVAPSRGVVGAGALQTGGTTATYGTATLAPGFMPDPANVNVTAGGGIDARALNLGAGCVGFVTREPDYILRLSGPSPNLRVYYTVPGARALSPTDTTLLINTAGGAWRCNDDSSGGANPTVDLNNAPAGQYDIWVGSYHAGDNPAGVLHITELRTNHP